MSTTEDINRALVAAQQAAQQAIRAASEARATAITINQIAANALFWEGTWTNTRYYAKYSVVLLNDILYVSLQDTNKNHSPDTSPSWWQPFGAAGGGTVNVTVPLAGDGSSGSPLTISPATESTPGSLSAADKTALDGMAATYVAKTRQINTTGPLTGGGALSGDLTLAISPATDSTAGSLSAADKTKLDGMAPQLSPLVAGSGYTFAQSVMGDDGLFQTAGLDFGQSSLFPAAVPATGSFVMQGVKVIIVSVSGTLTGVPTFSVGSSTGLGGIGNEICRAQTLPSSFLTATAGTVFDLTLAPDQKPVDVVNNFIQWYLLDPAVGDVGATCTMRAIFWGTYLPSWS
jgi:hypothetical protein